MPIIDGVDCIACLTNLELLANRDAILESEPNERMISDTFTCLTWLTLRCFVSGSILFPCSVCAEHRIFKSIESEQ
jgi:hypothetical protein